MCIVILSLKFCQTVTDGSFFKRLGRKKPHVYVNKWTDIYLVQQNVFTKIGLLWLPFSVVFQVHRISSTQALKASTEPPFAWKPHFVVQQNTFDIADGPWMLILMLQSTSMVNINECSSTLFNVEICTALYLGVSVAFFFPHPMCQTLIAEMIWRAQAENYFHLYIAVLFSITNKMWLLPIEMYLM